VDKKLYGLCEGDTIRYNPTKQLGLIARIHNTEKDDRYELQLRDPDEKIWCDDPNDIDLIWAIG